MCPASMIQRQSATSVQSSKTWLQQYNALQQQERTYHQSQLLHRLFNQNELNDVHNICNNTTKQLHVVRIELKQQIDKIHDSIELMCGTITALKTSTSTATDIQLQQLTQLNEIIEDMVYTFKSQHNGALDELNAAESTLNHELTMYSSKFDSWLNGNSSDSNDIIQPNHKHNTALHDSGKLSSTSDSNQPGDIKINIRAIDVQIDRYTCRWHSDDHELFIRLYNKGLLQHILVRQLMQYMPDKSENDILQHIDEYRQLQQLQQQKKQLIEQWKLNKQNTTQQSSNDDNTTNQLENNTNSTLMKHQTEQYRQQQRDKLLEWKQQQITRDNQLKLHTEQLQHEQLIKQQRKQQDRIRIKNEVEKYKSDRSIEQLQQQSITQQPNELNDMLSIEQKQKINQRNQQLLQRQYQLKQAKIDESTQRMHIQNKLAEKYAYTPDVIMLNDSTRLTRPTSAQQERIKVNQLERHQQKMNKDRPSTSYTIQSVTHKATPDWRKGI